MITLDHCSFTYNAGRRDALPALQDISLTIERGELIAIIGRNGSGKSTLARLLSGGLEPTAGSYRLAGVDAQAADARYQIRRRVGMVFQRPDDQLIAASVIDDIAFGPENLALPPLEINRRIERVVTELGLQTLANAAISALSAGEKQRTAIGGVLAIEPDCLILDEPTSMLAAGPTRRVLELVRQLRERSGAAVLHVTHQMPEAVDVDRVLVFDRGRLVLDGPPRAVFAERAELRRCGLTTPFVTAVGFALSDRGVNVPVPLLHADELRTALPPPAARRAVDTAQVPTTATALLSTERIGFTYLADTPQAQTALHDVTLRILRGSITAVLGDSQSGKSTLLDLLAGLRQPQHGTLNIADVPDADTQQAAQWLRQRSAIVFQQPDDQLIEPIVGMDIALGPRLRGDDPAASRAAVEAALTQVGLDYEEFRLRYISSLSGGQRRRTALAGALARKPQLLLLDEPGAGLDPAGRAELAGRLRDLIRDGATTLVIAGADLDEFTLLADELIILAGGTVVRQMRRSQLLSDPAQLRAWGLEVPEALQIVTEWGADIPLDRRSDVSADELADRLISTTGADHGA